MKVLGLTLLLAGNVVEGLKQDAAVGDKCLFAEKNQDCHIDQACSGVYAAGKEAEEEFEGTEGTCALRTNCQYANPLAGSGVVKCVRSRCEDN